MNTKIKVILILLMTILLFSQDYICWDRNYGGPYTDRAYSVIEMTDGNYAVAGSYMYQLSEDWYASHAHMYQLDPLGNVIRENPFDNIDTSSGIIDMIETSDGNIVAVTSVEYASASGRKFGVCIMKIDQNMNLLWEKRYTHGQTMNVTAITETHDYGLAICGDSDLNDTLRVGIIMKFDHNGDSLWTAELRNDGYNQFLGGYYNYMKSLISTDSNSIISVGYNLDKNGADAWIVGLDSDGGVLFNLDYGDSTVGDDFDKICYNSISKEIFVVGDIVRKSKSYSDLILFKINEEGNVLMRKEYELNPLGSWVSPQAICITDDGGCIITGYYYYDYRDTMFLIKLNENGDSLWTRTYGSPITEYYSDSRGYSVKQTSDGGYIVCGVNYYRLNIDGITKETRKMLYLK
jgi:hypothetical protein